MWSSAQSRSWLAFLQAANICIPPWRVKFVTAVGIIQLDLGKTTLQSKGPAMQGQQNRRCEPKNDNFELPSVTKSPVPRGYARLPVQQVDIRRKNPSRPKGSKDFPYSCSRLKTHHVKENLFFFQVRSKWWSRDYVPRFQNVAIQQSGMKIGIEKLPQRGSH